jgi:anti-anti-sigma factor
LQKCTLTFVDCGSTKPIHYKVKEKRAYFLTGSNLPLGVLENEIYHSHQVSYDQGDFFIFYSDGLTEAKSPRKELYGSERLVEIAERNPKASPKEIIDMIKSSVISFSQKSVFDDDVTLIVLKITSLQRFQQAKMEAGHFTSDLFQLTEIRKYIDQLCSHASGNAILLSELLQLAINEAFCNIIKHGYKNKKGCQIIIQGTLDDEGITIELTDHGESFNPLSVQEPSLMGTKDGGYGWFLIREIADHVTYVEKKTTGGWNHMHISKKYITEGSKMQLTHNEQDNVLIITPKMESLDALGAPEFKQKVMELIETSTSKYVVFDLHQLQFIDSSGLGSFLSVLRILHGHGGELKLACMNRPVRTMFELVSMHKIFEIFNSTDEAVKSF